MPFVSFLLQDIQWGEGVREGNGFTCERATADGPREHARQIEHADPLERILDVTWIGEHPLGRVADPGYRDRVDVRLVYPVRRPVHRLERAQLRRAEVSLEHDLLELFRGPLGERRRDGRLGRLALQDVEQTLFVASENWFTQVSR